MNHYKTSMKRILAILKTLKKWLPRWKTLQRRKAIIEKMINYKSNSQTKTSHTPSQRKLLIDVSVISRNDAGTGIQRVVRAIFVELIKANPSGYSIHPVAATLKDRYVYISWAGIEPAINKEITINADDVFLGLDLCTRIIPANIKQLSNWKEQGCKIHFLVYDILPILNPNWFPIKMESRFRHWLKSISILADATICISPHTQQDLQAWINDHYGITPEHLPSHVIPMGSDIEATMPTKGLPSNFTNILNKILLNKSALMVGTLEPRKGHSQILDAFEALWENNSDVLLVITGRPGWKTEELQSRLTKHIEKNNRLFWINNASDETLSELYKACTGLVVASLAEGFGLPIIEGLALNKPILARDLPVFRFTNHSNIDFFTGTDGKNLSIQIDKWLTKAHKNEIATKNISIDKTNRNYTIDPRITALPKWKDTVNTLLIHLTHH